MFPRNPKEYKETMIGFEEEVDNESLDVIFKNFVKTETLSMR